MRKLGLTLAIAALLSLSGARAQITLPWPGPGMRATAGACTMNGIFDLTNTCNSFYVLTGVI
jgi:uncharacterized PurR-regulated membrane protein YhhQ (DUF165 family)